MRKPRVILFDDDSIVLDVLRNFFLHRRYEVLAYSEPAICPIYGEKHLCTKPHPCSDMMIADYMMPQMNGLELLQAQTRMGCKLTPKNKALVSGFVQESSLRAVRELGFAFFEKPFEFYELGRWVDECESRIDLTTRVAIKRKEERTACSGEILYQAGADADVSRGVMINRSASGLCMKVNTLLRTDHSVILHAPVFPATSSALIRWAQATADNGYLVGLQRY